MERERERGEINWESDGERERKGGHSDRVMVDDTGVQTAVKGSSWRCSRHTGKALCAGAPSLPRSLSSPIHSHIAPPAPPAIHQSGHRGAAAQWDTSKRSLGERLRADAGTTQRSTEESRDGQLEKRSPNGMEKRSPTRTKHFILFTNQHYASHASKNPDTFFSLPWANGPLEYVNKGDNLIKKIQSSSLREQS